MNRLQEWKEELANSFRVLADKIENGDIEPIEHQIYTEPERDFTPDGYVHYHESNRKQMRFDYIVIKKPARGGRH